MWVSENLDIKMSISLEQQYTIAQTQHDNRIELEDFELEDRRVRQEEIKADSEEGLYDTN